MRCISREHKRERTSALRHFDGKRWHETPDSEFHRDILRLALYLHERVGMSAGDRVVLLAPLSPEWLVVDWATVTQGAVTVVLDPALSDAALAAAWERFAPVAAFVAGPEELRRVLALGSVRKLVTFRPGPDALASAFAQVMELGGALVSDRARSSLSRSGSRGRPGRPCNGARPPRLERLAYVGGADAR